MAIGILLGLLSGVTLGTITSFAALSYEYGATPIGLVFFRAILALAVTLGLTLIRRESLSIGRKGLGHALLTGISLCLVGFGYMAAVAFITPGLAVAVLYLFPLMVLAFESIGQRRLPALKTFLSFTIALVGIVVCLGLTSVSMDWRGIGFGLMAALGMAGYLLSSSRSSAAGFGYAPLVWANVFVMLVALVLVAVLPGGNEHLILPEATKGKLAMMAAAAFYATGIILSFLALRFATAAMVALMMNVEPITTLIAARLLVSEDLTWIQYMGMLIAIIGISLGGFRRTPKYSHD